MKPWKIIKSIWNNQSAKTRFWICLTLSGLIYLAFTLPFTLRRYCAVIPPVDYAKLTHYSVIGLIVYLAGIITLFSLYGLGLQLLIKEQKSQSKIGIIILTGILFALILAFSYPQTAIDLFVYAIRTRGWAMYDLLPFSSSPDAMPASDPWLGLAGEWVDAASPYGPVWEWLSLGAYHLSGGKYLAHLFALKAIGVLAYTGSIGLIYQILLLLRPRWAAAGAAFFAWNPLVLLESAQNAHNDIVMVFFLLMSIWAFTNLVADDSDKRKWSFSVMFVFAFAASILVKFIPIIVLPFFLLGLAARHNTWPRRIKSVLIFGFAIVLLVLMAMYPYWAKMDQWALLQAGKSAGRSLIALMVLMLRSKLGTNQAFDYVNATIYLTLGGTYIWQIVQVWARISNSHERGAAFPIAIFVRTILSASFYVFFWYVLIGAATFHAWYLLWFLALAALLVPKARPLSAAFVFSLAALLIIPYYETIRVWIPYLNRHHILGHAIGVPLLLVPTLWALLRPIRFIND